MFDKGFQYFDVDIIIFPISVFHVADDISDFIMINWSDASGRGTEEERMGSGGERRGAKGSGWGAEMAQLKIVTFQGVKKGSIWAAE